MRGNPFARGKAKPPRQPRDSFAAEAEKAFREFVLRPEFPCVGAKAAFNSSSYTLRVYGELGSDKAANELAAELCEFTRTLTQPDPHPNLLPQGEGTALSQRVRNGHKHGSVDELPLPLGEDRVRAGLSEYATFVAIFRGPKKTDELQFENLFWQQLRLLHELDAAHFGWDPNVRSDPGDPHFSFSFGGQALYVIGLHANSSREARRFPWPALVFNPHEQFEWLRADGKWKRMQETIRARDLEMQGSINPMLSDFGVDSEARQYSGRAVEENWRAPFKAVERKCPFAH
ncbi:MAG TPA: guanitoxin biosynthesis heme-dependent pre-guanitoxin N-hydroxylase GntA [Chthoniobacterales bacterium]|nr:guanitoxin biosynthesis heme-dependent pre-guanitoxin N-hydroxylase GntA [Chthoniobacterales bacterium]